MLILLKDQVFKVKYNYNPAGKLESITDLATGVITENRIYDEHMRTKRKQKEEES